MSAARNAGIGYAPRCYLSTNTNADGTPAWRVIYNGSPVCADKATCQEAMAAARQMRVTPSNLWAGDKGQWQPEFFHDMT